MEGKGEPPEAPLVLEESLQKEDLLEHVDALGHVVLFTGLGPPLGRFQVGASVLPLPLFVGNGRQLPPKVDRHPGHLHGLQDKKNRKYRQQNIGEQNQC